MGYQLLAHVGEQFFSMPPIHPILVNFTAALVPVSLGSDIAGRLTRRPSLTSVGWWTILYAALVTPLTVGTGWYWYHGGDHASDGAMSVHKWLGTALAGLIPLVALWRWRSGRGSTSPGWGYLVALTVLLAALSLQGHIGGIMSFGGGAAGDEDGGMNHSHSAVAPAQGHPGTGHAGEMSSHDHGPSVSPATTATSAHSGSGELQWRDHLDVKEQP